MKDTSKVSQILTQLIKSDATLTKKDGSINQAAAAKALGVHQPTLFRILSGKSTEPKANFVEVVCRYFNIQPSQLRGEAPIEIGGVSIPGSSVTTQSSARLAKSEELLLSLYRSLSASEKRAAIRVVAALKN